MGILWIILIGLVAGVIARFLVPGPNNPSGFILTVVTRRCLGEKIVLPPEPCIGRLRHAAIPSQ